MAEKEPRLAGQALNSTIREEGLRWTAADTSLSALPEAEQKKYLGLKVTQAELKRMENETELAAEAEQTLFAAGTEFAAPTSVDWEAAGYVTPVQNQGPCGSCVSFGTCASIEATIRVKMKEPGLAIDLSEAYCQFCGGGSCSGWGLTSGLEFAKTNGITDEACMPYEPRNMDCASERCSDYASQLTKLKSYTGHASAEGRKTAIAEIGPVVAGMAVYDDFFSYGDGIYEKRKDADLVAYHCICVVGYNDTDGYWLIKNSWGPGWGDGGYCKIAYGQSDLLIDSSWMFYSVDPDVVSKKGHGPAKYLLVDKVFGGVIRLWAYAGSEWRYRNVTDMELKGIAQELFDADRVDVWWDGPAITLVRGWKTP
jgi:C1A family cysteine protease